MTVNTTRFKPAACLLAFVALGWSQSQAQSRPSAAPAKPLPAVAEPAAAQLPLRQWSPRLKDLGLGGAMRLRGVESEAGVALGIRRDELVESARLRLAFTLSPALLPELSHLKVLFNDQLIQTIALPKERLGQPQTVDVAINPAYFSDYNQLRFQFVGHYTLDCEDPSHSSLWAEISHESALDLSLRQLPLRSDLALLPAPFFDVRDGRIVDVPFVHAQRPSLGQLKAAGSIASWLGMQAAYRGNRFPVFENRLPPRHAVVIATNGRRPDFLKDMPPVEQPTLSMMAHPSAPGAQLLLVLGKDDAQVQTAADALALGRAALSGQSIRVTGLEQPAPRKAYDAPRWITTERPVHLGELVERPSELQLRGTVLNDTIRVNARMAPDLFTWNAGGAPLNLIYRYTPTSLSDRGSLNVSINDQFVKSYPLQASGESRKNTIMLPLLEDGGGLARSDMKIPAFLVGGDNRLQFAFQIPPADMGRCRSTQPAELRAALDPQSSLDLTGFGHYMAMPNLAAFANSGFPFTKFADLSQTSVVLPDQPAPAEVEAYLTAVGRMAAATGYAGTRFRLLPASQIEQAGDTDILFISQDDRDGVLARWSSGLPALVEAGKRSVQPLTRGMNAFFELFRMGAGSPATRGDGRATLEGDGPLAAVVGLQSPLRPGRSVVGLTASDAQSMGLISQGLSDPGKVSLLHGDLGLIRGEAMESFRINPVYYVGDLPWWKRMWFHLHSHPVWLALLGIAAGLVLTLLVYGALRSLARRRLEGGHD